MFKVDSGFRICSGYGIGAAGVKALIGTLSMISSV
jgi:hypothetical protein